MEMKTAILNRWYYGSRCTVGDLMVNGQTFAIMERPWLNNQSGVSCIPEGVYRVRYLPRSASGKYKRVYHVLATEPRLGILIHCGNLPEHSRGCLLIGSKHGVLGSQRAVLASSSALVRFRRVMGTDDFKLIITSPKKLAPVEVQTL